MMAASTFSGVPSRNAMRSASVFAPPLAVMLTGGQLGDVGQRGNVVARPHAVARDLGVDDAPHAPGGDVAHQIVAR